MKMPVVQPAELQTAARYERKAPDIRLLYVEDSAINRQVFQQFCHQLSINVVVADEGKMGLEKYALQRFDALVVDCYMPGMDGYQMVREIRRKEEIDGTPKARKSQ